MVSMIMRSKLVYDDQFADLQEIKEREGGADKMTDHRKQLFTSVYPQKMTM